MRKAIYTALATLAFSNPVLAMDREYEVTVTNLTRGQSFTPVFAATHRPGPHLFEVGAKASDDLAALAEGGDTAPLVATFGADPAVSEAKTATNSLLGPGQTVKFTVMAKRGNNYLLSLAAMLIPTNDAFVAVKELRLPSSGETMVMVPAYDAGSEPNDELCANIPGPVCGGVGLSTGVDGEGFVHIHAGIHGSGELIAADYDWRNPVAKITVKRMR